MVRRISSSRPMTGSSFPWRARSVRSVVYFFSASRLPSASACCTESPPRTALMACSKAARCAPCSFSRRPVAPLSSAKASKNISEAMKASLRLSASLSVRFSRLFRSREMLTSPPCPCTVGKPLMLLSKACFSAATLTPARARIEPVPPSSWLIKASNKCCGSI